MKLLAPFFISDLIITNTDLVPDLWIATHILLAIQIKWLDMNKVEIKWQLNEP